MLTFGSLFSGVGGLDLGFEQAGMRALWQVEADEFCRAVLSRHWPSTPKFGDVRDVGRRNLSPVDVICGGFPCQDISSAGKKAGIEGERSGLWSEFHRIICELRPRYVCVENVEALRHKGRGLYRVLGDLAASGYDVFWDCLPAAAFGAPHLRDRIFVIAWDATVSNAGGGGWRNAASASLFARFDKPQFPAWQAAQRLEPIEVLGVAYPQLPGDLRMVDGLSSGVDKATLTARERKMLCADVPWGAQRVKGCGNAVAVPVAAHVGRCLVEFARMQNAA